MPTRRKNSELRTREYLTEAEVERLQRAAAKMGRYGHRDATSIMIAYRHALRAAELVSLEWTQVDLEQRVLHVRRVKRGTPSTHPLSRGELAALRKLERHPSGFVFVSERGSCWTTSAWAKMMKRVADEALVGLAFHPHMLRHACGYHLANQGRDTRAIQAYMGHRNIQHTVRYTDLSPDRFKDFWKD